jgi:CheY-like chemotaxis protein
MKWSPEMLLVVEDDVDIRETVCLFLQGAGYQTAAAANGKEAIDWLTAHGAPSLILLDLTMPVMDGYQFLRLKEADPTWVTVPVVVLTAVLDGSRLLRAHRIARCVQKPIWPAQLLDVVQQCTPAIERPRADPAPTAFALVDPPGDLPR